MANRPIRLPSKEFANEGLPVLELKKLDGWRVHSDPWPAVGFRKVTSHRFTHPDAPQDLLYLADDLETCLWECFGDMILDSEPAMISKAKWFNSRASRVNLKGALTVCDLTDLGTRRALKVDLPALMSADLSVPHRWGLAIQTHPANIDGFLFPSRFTGKHCLVLFDRPTVAARLKGKKGDLLPDIDDADNFLAENTIHLV